MSPTERRQTDSPWLPFMREILPPRRSNDRLKSGFDRTKIYSTSDSAGSTAVAPTWNVNIYVIFWTNTDAVLRLNPTLSDICYSRRKFEAENTVEALIAELLSLELNNS